MIAQTVVQSRHAVFAAVAICVAEKNNVTIPINNIDDVLNKLNERCCYNCRECRLINLDLSKLEMHHKLHLSAPFVSDFH